MDSAWSIAAVPSDVLLHILSYCHVLDIIRARQTCHLLQDLCASRSLWLDKLRTMGLETPSHLLYALDDLSTLNVEYAVTRSLRFPRQLLDFQVERKLELGDIPQRQGDDIINAHLFTGGRYILTSIRRQQDIVNGTHAGYLQLWDLDDEHNRGRPIVEVSVPKWLLGVTVEKGQDDRRSVRIVTSSGTQPTQYTLNVFRLEWPVDASSSPAIQKVATSINVHIQPSCVAIQDSTVAFILGGSVAYWDWVADSYGLGLLEMTIHPTALVLKLPHVLLLDSMRGVIALYNLPVQGIRSIIQSHASSDPLPAFDCTLLNNLSSSTTTPNVSTYVATASLGFDGTRITLHSLTTSSSHLSSKPVFEVQPLPLETPNIDTLRDITLYLSMSLNGDCSSLLALCPPRDMSHIPMLSARMSWIGKDGLVTDARADIKVGINGPWRNNQFKMDVCPFRGRVVVASAAGVSYVDICP